MVMRSSSTEYARKNARLQLMRISAEHAVAGSVMNNRVKTAALRRVRIERRCAGHAMMFTPPST